MEALPQLCTTPWLFVFTKKKAKIRCSTSGHQGSWKKIYEILCFKTPHRTKCCLDFTARRGQHEKLKSTLPEPFSYLPILWRLIDPCISICMSSSLHIIIDRHRCMYPSAHPTQKTNEPHLSLQLQMRFRQRHETSTTQEFSMLFQY